MSAAPILVVIPTLNEVRTITHVLEALRRDLPVGPTVRFVVADGGSSDGTIELVHQLAAQTPELHLLHNPRRLQSAAINLALATHGADAGVLIRCDAHADYPGGYVRRLVESLERHAADAVVVPMDSTGDGCLQRAIAWVCDSPVGSGGSAHRGGRRSGFVDHGHHAAFRVESLRRAGGYDESFSHNEDAELDCRQRALGSRIYLDSEIRIGYHPRATLRGLARQYFNYGRGRSRTLRRHPGSLRLRQLAVPAAIGACVLAILAAPWWPALLALPLAYLAILAAASVAIALRQRSACGLLAGPAALAMHVAWAFGFGTGMLMLREPRWQAADAAPAAPTAATAATAAAMPVPIDVLLVDPSLFTAPYDAALTRGLVAAGVRPTWAVRPLRPGDRQEIEPAYVDDFFYRRVDRQTSWPAPLRAAAKGLAHALGLVRLVARVFRRRPAVVHFQWTVVPFLDVLAMALIRRVCPVVLTVHDSDPFNGERLSLLQNLGFDLPLRAADQIIVHTRGGYERLVQRGIDASRLHVLAHGPLELQARPDPAARPAPDGLHRFVAFGEIKPYKGIDVLVEAAGRLAPALRARARFIVAGRPRMDMTALQQRVAELGLDSTFEFRLRRLDEQEMADLFDAADTFVFPYRQIDASGVYFLVKALGRWLIASRVGIFAEDLRHGVQGALVESADVAALAAALAHAILQAPRPPRLPDTESWAGIGRQTRVLYEQAALAPRRRGAMQPLRP